MEFDSIFANTIDVSSTLFEASLSSKDTNLPNNIAFSNSQRIDPIEIPLDRNTDC
jgi:glutamine cyclotransferase